MLRVEGRGLRVDALLPAPARGTCVSGTHVYNACSIYPISFYLSIYLSVCLSLFIYIYLHRSINISVFIYLSIYLSVSISIHTHISHRRGGRPRDAGGEAGGRHCHGAPRELFARRGSPLAGGGVGGVGSCGGAVSYERGTPVRQISADAH